MKRTLILLSILSLATACNSNNSTQSKSQSQTQGQVNPVHSPDDVILDGDVLKNSNFGFEVTVPPNSFLTDKTDAYTRTQNYSKDGQNENIALSKGEYYLEISVQNLSVPCKEVVNRTERRINGHLAYQGYGPEGGDPGGARYALCVVDAKSQIYVQVTEVSGGSIAKAIFGSFRFR